MERRKVDILCVQETRWKGSKAHSIGAGFKLFYYGVDSKRNGVGVVLKEEFVRNVLEVKRVSDRVMSLKLEIEGVMLNVVSGYAPQVGCELEEKERFWSELDEVMESIPTGERVVIGADFNGHVGEGNRGDEEVMGKFGVKERNLEGQMVVDFAKRMDMAVVNTYFQKREEHRVTYKSGGRRTQVDYILCRRGNLKEISDCKVVVGESVARQHRMVVCRMTLMVCKKKRSKIEKKTKWWKLKKEECCDEFRQKLRQALGVQVVLPDDWETTAEVIRETGRKVLGVSSGSRKEDKETWWWNEEVQDSIQRKRLAKKKWDMDRTEGNRQEYKELQRRVKREVSKAKQKAYDELYTRLDTREGEKDLYRLARQRDRDEKDVQQVRVIKDRDGRVLTSEESVQRLGAFDRVLREEPWYCMRKSGVAEKYVRVVQDMYERSRTVVRCAVGQTEEFNVEVGLHQGSTLSPFLFAIVMDQLSEEVRQESPWTMFADDIVVCSESREQVEENLERWRFVLERRGMKVSHSKTEYMCVNEREGSGTCDQEREKREAVAVNTCCEMKVHLDSSAVFYYYHYHIYYIYINYTSILHYHIYYIYINYTSILHYHYHIYYIYINYTSILHYHYHIYYIYINDTSILHYHYHIYYIYINDTSILHYHYHIYYIYINDTSILHYHYHIYYIYINYTSILHYHYHIYYIYINDTSILHYHYHIYYIYINDTSILHYHYHIDYIYINDTSILHYHIYYIYINNTSILHYHYHIYYIYINDTSILHYHIYYIYINNTSILHYHYHIDYIYINYTSILHYHIYYIYINDTSILHYHYHIYYIYINDTSILHYHIYYIYINYTSILHYHIYYIYINDTSILHYHIYYIYINYTSILHYHYHIYYIYINDTSILHYHYHIYYIYINYTSILHYHYHIYYIYINDTSILHYHIYYIYINYTSILHYHYHIDYIYINYTSILHYHIYYIYINYTSILHYHYHIYYIYINYTSILHYHYHIYYIYINYTSILHYHYQI
ncbi:hypothetical protein QTP70_003752 [Hemibagrus guttatus]|uniref:ribonuclease H n=1 Tax=Hemibagrus guttatus TaxID=175788 RepID=A0AAE0QN49_9TELE|nr:hypothetical protein QTP70_003752 [Hemibagrus guttatus]